MILDNILAAQLIIHRHGNHQHSGFVTAESCHFASAQMQAVRSTEL